jgi:hypothetical protein
LNNKGDTTLKRRVDKAYSDSDRYHLSLAVKLKKTPESPTGSVSHQDLPLQGFRRYGVSICIYSCPKPNLAFSTDGVTADFGFEILNY